LRCCRVRWKRGKRSGTLVFRGRTRQDMKTCLFSSKILPDNLPEKAMPLGDSPTSSIICAIWSLSFVYREPEAGSKRKSPPVRSSNICRKSNEKCDIHLEQTRLSLAHQTRGTPHVGTGTPRCTQDDLRAAILPGLDVIDEMVVYPGRIAQVDDLDGQPLGHDPRGGHRQRT
jgi:hypothetical protein